MPFGKYANFAACVDDNADKDDPEGYCGALKAKLEGKGGPLKLTRSQVGALCPSCAAEMERRGLTALNLGAVEDLPVGLVKALVAKVEAPGFFELCMNEIAPASAEVENPEAFCAALHERLTGMWPAAAALASWQAEHQAKGGVLSSILRGLAQLVGGVERVQADAGTMTVEPGEGERVQVTRTVAIAKADIEKRLVYGVVYEPGVPDAHDDFMSAGEIEKAAHGFMMRYATLEGETGTNHLEKVGRDQLVVVESFVAPVDFALGSQKVRKGTWVMVGKVLADDLWGAIKKGQYTGWSFEGWGRRQSRAA